MIPILAGHCGIVTGATTPWGRAVALELARDCARMAIGYRGYRGGDLEAAEQLARDVVCRGGEALPLRVSIVPREMDGALAHLVDFWGRIDFVVDLDADSLVSRAALPLMLDRSSGRVVAVGPIRGASLAYDRPQLKDFAARGVAVNCIATGAVGSEPCACGAQTGPYRCTCIGAVARAEDVAATVYFLLTQGACITGQLLDLSGVLDDAPPTFAPPVWSRWNPQLLQRLGPEVGSRAN
jgi:NAD(P)-dependent dehydrogenase (short-subunit alcohol dehydrogenase family)